MYESMVIYNCKEKMVKCMSDKLNINYSDYDESLSNELKRLKDTYDHYLKNPSNRITYVYLKEHVFNISLMIKSALVCQEISNEQAGILNDYIWGLLL